MQNISEDEIQRRIRNILENHPYSQREWAVLLGVSQPAVSLYKKGRIPPLPVLIRLAHICGVSLDELILGENAPPPKVQENGKPYGGKMSYLERLFRSLNLDDQQLVIRLMERLATKPDDFDE